MTRYVDGFVTPVKKDRLDEYKKLGELAGKVWCEHGALEYVECVADDVSVGKTTSFPRSVQLEEDEIVVFSWITYGSREDRDRVLEKAMSDPRLQEMTDTEKMPFDARRMFWGGFKTFIEMK